MATNSKEVQKRADEKRKGKRARAWTTVIYPDSAPKNFEEILRDELVECLISPLHDKDKEPDGSGLKKAHWHVVLSFKNPVTSEHAKEVFDKINGVGIQKVKDFAQLARYLCHLDHPNKYQYDPADVVSIGAIDYRSLIMSGADEDEMLDEIFEAMDANGLITYSMVVRFTRRERPEWKCLVYRKYTRQISEYAKGLNHEMKTGIIEQ